MVWWNIGFNNHIIANCPQSVTVKKVWKSVKIVEDINENKVARFYWPTLYRLSVIFVAVPNIRSIITSLCEKLAIFDPWVQTLWVMKGQLWRGSDGISVGKKYCLWLRRDDECMMNFVMEHYQQGFLWCRSACASLVVLC